MGSGAEFAKADAVRVVDTGEVWTRIRQGEYAGKFECPGRAPQSIVALRRDYRVEVER